MTLDLVRDSFAPLTPASLLHTPTRPRLAPGPRDPEPCPLSRAEVRKLVLDTLG